MDFSSWLRLSLKLFSVCTVCTCLLVFSSSVRLLLLLCCCCVVDKVSLSPEEREAKEEEEGRPNTHIHSLCSLCERSCRSVCVRFGAWPAWGRERADMRIMRRRRTAATATNAAAEAAITTTTTTTTSTYWQKQSVWRDQIVVDVYTTVNLICKLH